MHAEADIEAIVEYLLLERQRLRAAPDEAAAREANRLALAYWQRRRSRRAGRAASHPGPRRRGEELGVGG